MLKPVMKTTKNILLGFTASLLFAVGFAKAADRLDTYVQGVMPEHFNGTMTSMGPCAVPCEDPPPPDPGAEV